MNEIHARFRGEGLVRPLQGRVLAGVCAGLGRRFGIDPWPARLLFLLAVIVLHAALIPIYVILWILMPAEETAAEASSTPSTFPAQ
jgi:phage shock protein C